MPLIAFVDIELLKELDKMKLKGDNKEIFPEHSFIGMCLKVGLTINDLKLLTYVDVIKILISLLPQNNEKSGAKIATQRDIDRLLS